MTPASAPASPPLPPAGWYPDPADPSQERYWDGAQWSYSVRPVVGVAPAWPSPTPDFAGQASTAESAPGVQHPEPTGPPAPQGYGSAPFGGPSNMWTPGAQASAYAQPALAPVPRTVDGRVLAGWGWRLLGTILDWLVLSVLLNVLTWNLQSDLSARVTQYLEALLRASQSGTAAPTLGDYGLLVPIALVTTLGVVLTTLYSTLMLRFRGATLGQLAVGNAVVPIKGRAPGMLGGRTSNGLPWRTALIRSLVWAVLDRVSVLFLVQVVNGLMPLWDRKRQTIHDKIARTQVIRTR